MNSLKNRKGIGPTGLITASVVLTVVFVLAGIAYYNSQIDRIRLQKYRDLASVTKMKVSQIERWRHERVGDVRDIARSPFWRRAVAKILHSSTDTFLLSVARDRLALERDLNLYSDAFVTDLSGKTAVFAGSVRPEIYPSELPTLKLAGEGKGPATSDLFLNRNGTVQIDFMDAVRDDHGRPVGVVIMRSYASDFLYPVVESWPVFTRTAESVLHERWGDSVMVMSPLRGDSSSVLEKFVPLRFVRMPGVQAALGKTGPIEGTDYKGRKVLAYAVQVPNSPWYLVSKVDVNEAYGEMWYRGAVVALLVLMSIIISIAFTAYLYRHREAYAFKRLYEIEAERRKAVEQLGKTQAMYRIVAENSHDGIIFLDQEGRIKQRTPSFLRISGYTDEERLGRTEMELVHPEDREKFLEAWNTVLERANYVMKSEYRILRKDGKWVWLETDMQNFLGNPEVNAVVLISHDVTSRKESEKSQMLQLAAMSAAADAIVITDIKGTIQYVNTSFTELTGYSYAEAVGQNPRVLKSGLQDPSYYKDLWDTILSGEVWRGELVNRRKDGSTYQESMSVTPIKDDKGEISHFIAVKRDITERKRAEEELHSSEKRLRAVYDAIPDLVFRISGDGTFIDYKADDKDLYVPPSAINGRRACDLLPPDLAKLIEEKTGAALTTGKMQNYDYELPIPGRGIREYDARMVPSGPNEVIAFIRDVTDSRRTLEQLRQKEEQLSLVFDNMTDVLFNLRVEPEDRFRFIEVNRTFLRATGFTEEQVIGKDFRDVLPLSAHDLVLGKYKEAIDTGRPVYWEEASEYPAGRKVGEVSVAPIFNSLGKCTNLIGTVHDLTEQKKSEEKQKSLEAQLLQSQKIESIGRLAGGVAHDYNNILGVVLGYTQLINRKLEKDSPVYRYIELIDSAAKRGANLTRQLLAFARQEIISPKPLNPDSTISSLLSLLKRTIGEDLELKFVPGSKPWNINADPTQFDQVLLNLATNARDAIQGVGSIIIETSKFTLNENEAGGRLNLRPGDYVVIAVTDNGKGMDSETVAKIFEPFFTTKSSGKGTGLGLSTVYGIVNQNGGAVEVHSVVNEGTTFRLYFPRYLGEIKEAASDEGAVDLSGTETILVVEDQAELLELAKNILEDEGYRVLTALTPSEGLLIAEAFVGEIDMLLTDVIMPVMNGKELNDKIKAVRPNLKTVFMSGYTADVISNRGVLAKGVEFIQKPFTPQSLAAKIREVFDSR